MAKPVIRLKDEKYDPNIHKCPKCKEYKPLDQFYKTYSTQRGKHSPYCKVCNDQEALTYRLTQQLKKEGVETFTKKIERDQLLLNLKQTILLNFLKGKEVK